MTSDTSGIQNASDNNIKGGIDLEHYRRLVKQFCDLRRYQTALFWAEKVCCLSQNDPNDVYHLAQCMFLLKEYHRAAHIIRYHKLEKAHIPCYGLLLECLYEAKELNEAVAIINSIDIDYLATSLIPPPSEGCSIVEGFSVLNCDDMTKNELMASINYMKGKIFQALDNRGLAMDCYVRSLHNSVYSYEALEALVQHEMLMAWEEKELLEHLPMEQQLAPADEKLVTKLYETKFKKHYQAVRSESNSDVHPIGNLSSLKSVRELIEKIENMRSSEAAIHKEEMPKFTNPTNQAVIMSPGNRVLYDMKAPSYSFQVSLMRATSVMYDTQRSTHLDNSHGTFSNSKDTSHRSKELPLSTCMSRISQSIDVITAVAEKLFYDCEYKKSMKILNDVLKIDPYHDTALTVQIGCLIEYNDYNKLFYVAHKLVDRYPDKAISWYAVGCYYDLIGKSDPARRYLSKATTLDRLYGPAWLAYGHSFAKDNEHDQAMAVYFKATQLMRGCHLPLLYIGVECGLTKNLELAEKFFYQAMSVAPLDVYVLHELGVIKYEYEYYVSAEEVFRATADIVIHRAKQNNEEVSSRWEPLFNNLGHCCRKNKKYMEALEYHEQALLLKPQNSQTYTSIGFVYALLNRLEDAITNFHKSLSLSRDCIVTSTILKTCIEDLMNEDNVIDSIYGKSPSSLDNNSIYKLRKTARTSLSNLDDKSPINFACIKLKFDDDDLSPTTDSNIDPSVTMDISMEN